MQNPQKDNNPYGIIFLLLSGMRSTVNGVDVVLGSFASDEPSAGWQECTGERQGTTDGARVELDFCPSQQSRGQLSAQPKVPVTPADHHTLEGHEGAQGRHARL